MWDTGATGTVIRKKIVNDLGLQPSGKTDILSVGEGDETQETKDVNTYLVNVYLPNNVAIVGLAVAEGAPPGCDILIGMDIITSGDFAITNQNGKTCMSFILPSSQTIDFVDQINKFKETSTSEGKRKLRNKRKRERRNQR